MAKTFAAQLAHALENSWPAVARPSQLPPPGVWWLIWLLLAGRGFGKTRRFPYMKIRPLRARSSALLDRQF
jgi:phage terminase large subunit-like protein